jgi:hypothetical protein
MRIEVPSTLIDRQEIKAALSRVDCHLRERRQSQMLKWSPLAKKGQNGACWSTGIREPSGLAVRQSHWKRWRMTDPGVYGTNELQTAMRVIVWIPI